MTPSQKLKYLSEYLDLYIDSLYRDAKWAIEVREVWLPLGLLVEESRPKLISFEQYLDIL